MFYYCVLHGLVDTLSSDFTLGDQWLLIFGGSVVNWGVAFGGVVVIAISLLVCHIS